MAVPSKLKVRVSGDHSKSNREKIRNLILLGLPAKECDALWKSLEFVDLPTHTELHEAGEPIKFVYFIEDGLASVLTMMVDGKSVEVGLAGKEGFVGLPLVAGFSTSAMRVIMQVGGSGYRINAKDFLKVLSTCPTLEKKLNQYSLHLAMQAAHVAACNRVHEVDERLARWLLMSQDRLGGDNVPLTQEFLAHMLGTRRASVTVAAGMLQAAGLITYNRGNVTVENRAQLEDAACECYEAMKNQTDQMGSGSKSSRYAAALTTRLPRSAVRPPIVERRKRPRPSPGLPNRLSLAYRADPSGPGRNFESNTVWRLTRSR
jgi:CRP-like cAMP-binding protein